MIEYLTVPAKSRDFSLVIPNQSLLPKKAYNRGALNYLLSNIKPRLFRISQLADQGFRRLTLIGVIVFLLLGYYPAFSFPPIKRSEVMADEAKDAQKDEILKGGLPYVFQLPHPGYLSSRYSYYHPGVDIATGLGMPIHPIAEGVVEEVNFWFWGYGHHVVISHPQGVKSLYGHMGRVFVKKGQPVSPLTTLGEVGTTGRTSGPHTHLEVLREGRYIDPLTVLPEIPNYPIPETINSTGGNKPAHDLNLNLRKTLRPDFS